MSLHLSKCHIVGNLMPRLISHGLAGPTSWKSEKYILPFRIMLSYLFLCYNTEIRKVEVDEQRSSSSKDKGFYYIG